MTAAHPDELLHSAEATDPEFVDTHGEHKPDTYYFGVAAVLFVLTALEVSTYYFDFGPAFLPMLLLLMSIKFVMVVLLFMHLRFDAPIFSFLFWSGFALALMVYVGVLATFQFFAS